MNDPAETGGREPFWTRGKIQVGVAILVVAVVGGLLATSRGCKPRSRVSKGTAQDTPEKAAAQRNQLFDTAWDGLQRPEVFDGMFGDDEEIGRGMDRLNQWLEAQKRPEDWHVDPLAAATAKSLASFAGYVKPVDAALARPGYVLELKDIARRFEAPAARLEKLAQRRSLRELDQLARNFEDSIKQIDEAARQIADPVREKRELDPDRNPALVQPRTGTGTGTRKAESDLREFEAKLLDQFSRRVRDPAKQATFAQLYKLAGQLDYPGRLREAKPLEAFAQALEDFAAKHSRQEVEALVVQYEEVVSLYGGAWNKTRLSAQMRFILDEFANAARMKDLAQWKDLNQVVGEVAERLKNAAKRTDRSELRELAARVDEARNKWDMAALKAAAAQLAELVRPGSSDDLKGAAGQLADRAELLVQLAGQLGQLAGQNQSENLQRLAEYAKGLATEVQATAKLLENPPSATDPQNRDAYLDQFTARYLTLSARVSRLAEHLDYFATLGTLRFPSADWNAVREAILLRDVSHWARGEEADDASRAKRLFDWTVRNIQLEPDEADPSVRHFMKRPWETLILGTGTAMERAWVFILLARQQGLDAAVLALEDVALPAHQRLRPWAVAVLSEGHLYLLDIPVVGPLGLAWPGVLTEGKLHLFDPHLGLPIPGANGIKLDESGQLDVRPATLAQVRADERLLRQLDLDGGRPYWVKGSDLKRVVALVEGSPPYLAQRMRVIESRLVGEDHVVLSTSPDEKAAWIKAWGRIAEARLWSLPYETWFQRSQLGDEPIRRFGSALQRVSSGALWKGRVRHLEGKFTDESNALQFYGKARLSNREIEGLAAAVKVPETIPVNRASQREPEFAAAAGASLKAIAVRARQDAGYWLGLAAFEQGKYNMATDYLAGGTIEAYPDGAWTPGAKYNLGRVYEAQKNYSQAIRQYRDNTGSAQSNGDQLRAQWLEKLTRLPGLPVEKEPIKKEGLSKKVGPAKGESPGKEKSGVPDLPVLPGLPAEKEPPKRESPPKKEVPAKAKKEKPRLPDLPDLPGLPEQKEPSKTGEKTVVQ